MPEPSVNKAHHPRKSKAQQAPKKGNGVTPVAIESEPRACGGDPANRSVW